MSGGRAVLFVVVATVAAIASAVFFMRSIEPKEVERTATVDESDLFESPIEEEPGEPSPPPARFATETYVNEEGGYAFGHPPGWNVQATGEITKLVSPDEEAVVTFGLGIPDDLQGTARALADYVEAEYDKARIVGEGPAQLGGRDVYEVLGSAVNESGVEVTVRAVALAGDDDTLAATVFVSAEDANTRLMTIASEVLASFGPSTAG